MEKANPYEASISLGCTGGVPGKILDIICPKQQLFLPPPNYLANKKTSRIKNYKAAYKFRWKQKRSSTLCHQTTSNLPEKDQHRKFRFTTGKPKKKWIMSTCTGKQEGTVRWGEANPQSSCHEGRDTAGPPTQTGQFAPTSHFPSILCQIPVRNSPESINVSAAPTRHTKDDAWRWRFFDRKAERRN